ncbi:MAG: ABC transporter permease [Patescibacteria group bacterium]|nr:ABC transporter permease [Patescibacteria group bacterium]
MSSEYIYILEIIKNSIKSLLDNKRRTLLTTLGIIIGVSSVIIIMAIGAGAQGLILGQVKKVGTDLIGILPGKQEADGPPATAFGIVITTLTYEDALALRDKKNVPDAIGIVAHNSGMATVSWKDNKIEGANIDGCTVDMPSAEKYQIEKGRFFNEAEERGVAKVAVLGYTTARDLFGENEPVGQRIKIKNQSFEVIGVLAEKGKIMMQDMDSYVFIPVSSMQRLITGVRYVNYIRLKVNDENNLGKAKSDIAATLRDRHNIKDKTGKEDDFTINSAADALKTLKTVTDSLRFFLAAMAALSLLVGGIGIMNIMLIRVAQRTREIGLRKAVGASGWDIKLQFLVEAINITVLGGLIGIACGELVSWLVAIIAKTLGYDWAFVFSPISIAISVGVSMAIGLIFGLYPSNKAAKLSPIEALRYE